MLRIFTLLLMFVFQPLALGGQSIPSEFLGHWVPKSASCSSPLSLNVTSTSVTFKNAKESRTFSNVEPCFSCEGGARYSGIVVWLTTTGSEETPFTVYFNASEIKNTAVIELESSELKSKFPLNNLRLKRCKP